MITSSWVRCTAGASVLMLACFTSVAAQAAPSDPWKMAPASPTTCFADDGFSETLSSASAAIKAEVERQKKVNDEARQQFDNMDMAEKAQRMQAFMMKNPQAAAKMLEAQQAAGAAAAATLPEAQEVAGRLVGELQQLQASFASAAEQAVQPSRAKQRQLIDTKTVGVNNAVFTSAADHAQYVQLVAEENAAYEKVCAPYFGAGGSFHNWLKRYRAELTERVIAQGENDLMVVQLQALGLPGDGYRPTAPLEQVDLYLNYAVRRVFDIRWRKAQPVIELRH